MSCCGDGISVAKSTNYATDPEKFQLVMLANHSSVLSTLTGKATGKNYSQRKDGDQVYVLHEDIAAEPEKYVPIVD